MHADVAASDAERIAAAILALVVQHDDPDHAGRHAGVERGEHAAQVAGLQQHARDRHVPRLARRRPDRVESPAKGHQKRQHQQEADEQKRGRFGVRKS